MTNPEIASTLAPNLINLINMKKISIVFQYAIFHTFINTKRALINVIKNLLWKGSKTSIGFDTVVVIKIGGLGDFVFGIPALNLLRENMPNAKITLITTNSLNSKGFKFSGRDPKELSDLPWVNLVKNSVDEVLSVPDLSITSIRKLASMLSVSEKKAIFILGYPGMTFSSSLKKIVFARLLTNYTDACFGTDKFLDWQFMRKFQISLRLTKHKMIGDLDSVMEGFPGKTIDTNKLNFSVSISEDIFKQACTKYGSNIIQNLILLAPLSTTLHKQWPVENFVKIIKKINKTSKNFSFALIGTLDHYAVLDRIFNSNGSEIHNLCGQLSIEEIAALLSCAKGYIGNDGGMSQLAGVIGCPSVVVFNSVEEDWVTYPWQSLNGIVRNHTDCSPCLNALYCPENHHKCVIDISIDTVYSKVDEVILAPVK